LGKAYRSFSGEWRRRTPPRYAAFTDSRRHQLWAIAQIRAFDPHTAGPEIWRSFHECRRALSAELDPDDPILSDAETEIEMRRIDPLDDCLRWLAFSEGKVIGFASAFFRRPGTADAAEHAPFLFAGGRVRAEARRRGAG